MLIGDTWEWKVSIASGTFSFSVNSQVKKPCHESFLLQLISTIRRIQYKTHSCKGSKMLKMYDVTKNSRFIPHNTEHRAFFRRRRRRSGSNSATIPGRSRARFVTTAARALRIGTAKQSLVVKQKVKSLLWVNWFSNTFSPILRKNFSFVN